MNPLRIFLLAALVLVVFGVGNADAREPEWAYEYGDEEGEEIESAISADGEYIVIGSDTNDDLDNQLILLHKESSTPLWKYNPGSSVRSVDISADGEYIVAADEGINLHLFGKDSNIPIWTSSSLDGDINSVDISADGEYIAVGAVDKVYLFDKDNSQPLWKFNVNGTVKDVSISADGGYIVSGDGDNVLLLDKQRNICFQYETDWRINSVDISDDGKKIVAANEQILYYFDLDSDSCNNTPIWSYENNDNWISSVVISADGSTIALGSEINSNNKKLLLLFDISSNLPLWTYLAEKNEGTVSSVDISADGEYIIAGISHKWNSRSIYLFSKEDNFPKWNFEAGDRKISSVSISGDGEIIAGCARLSGNNSAAVYLFTNNQFPIATIDSIAPSPSQFGKVVIFNGTGFDNDGNIDSYKWESSIDGILSTEENFSINNLSLGRHIIKFQVQDNDGEWGENISDIFVYAPPIAIAGQNSSGTPGVPLQFSGAGTDEDGTIAKYEWDFDGDGVFEWSSSENGRELNVYNNEGTYTATLRVTDNDGFTDTDTVVIIISEKTIQLDDSGNVIVEDAGEDEEGIPSISLITSLILIGLLAIFRRK